MKDFFANLFEFWGSFASDAADDLLEHVYTPIAFIMLVVVALVCLFYYKILDKPSFHRYWHWLIVWACTTAGMFIISWIYTDGTFKKQDLEHSVTDYANFLIAVCLYTTGLFFAFSLLFKQFSINRRRTPF